jgi:hypothetical protein
MMREPEPEQPDEEEEGIPPPPAAGKPDEPGPEPEPESDEQPAAELSSASDLGATAAIMLEHLVSAMRAPAAPSTADHLHRAAAALEKTPDEAVLVFVPQLAGTLGVLAAAGPLLRCPAPKQLLALLYRRAATSQSLAVRLYWALATGQHTAELAAQLLLEPDSSLQGDNSGEPLSPLPAAWRAELRRQQLLVNELGQVGRLHHERRAELK